MAKTKKKEIQKQGLRPSQKAKAEKLRQKQEAKIKAEQEPTFVQESISETSNVQTVVQNSQATDNTNSTDDVSAVKVINVKNAEGEQDTVAEILIQNNIDYTPKVSVVMPVYNVEPYLRQCLDSVINQTLKEIEIICVDDGSTDSSLEILKEYAAKDNRITVITQKNAGSGKARNNGINNAKGEFIAFMDSDDMYPSEKTLEHMYKAAIENNVLICGGSLSQLREGGKIVTDPKEFEEGYSFEKDGIVSFFDYQFDFGYWRFIYNRQFLKENQLYFPDYLRCQDPPFFVKTMCEAVDFYALKEPTYVYRVSYKQISWNERKAVDVYKARMDILDLCNRYQLNDLYKRIAGYITSEYLLKQIADLIENNENVRCYVKKAMEAIDTDKIIDSKALKSRYNTLQKLRDENAPYKPTTGVSIIIPCYNVEPYLRQCLDSVVNQTMRDIQIICINDESPDNSLEILKEYAAKDDRIVVIDQKNKGLSGSRNNALKIITGEYVEFLDSDDWLELNTVETLYKKAKKYDIDVLNFEGQNYFPENDKYVQDKVQKVDYVPFDKPYYDKEDIEQFANIIPVSSCRFFYKASFIKEHNYTFPEGLCFEDNLFTRRAFCEMSRFGVEKSIFYNRRMHEGQITANFDKLFKDYLTVVLRISKYYVERGLENKPSIQSIISVYCGQIIKRFTEFSMENQALYIGNLLNFFNDISQYFNLPSDVRNYVKGCNPSYLYKKVWESWCEHQQKSFNIDSPRAFNDKIQWLKLYDSTSIKTRLADKYLVRDWVKSKIGENYLIPLLGVYDNFNEIDFDKLPNQFVIKCNHGSGYNIIVKDKAKLDLRDTKKKLNNWLKENFTFRAGCELHYRDMKPKIIIEQYMDDGTGDLRDYKYTCFDGKPEFIWIDSDRHTEHKRNLYDLNWKQLPCKVNSSYNTFPSPEKPKCLEQMNKLASVLSQGFSYVRVDFYIINDKIYFGEMTFTSSSGTEDITPQSFEKYLSNKLSLPQVVYDIDKHQYYRYKKQNKFMTYLLFPYYLAKSKLLQRRYVQAYSLRLKKNLTPLRIDLKNVGNENNALNLKTDAVAFISQPVWFTNNEGIGQMVRSLDYQMKINIKVVNDGNLKFFFRGDNKIFEGKRFPVWIDYKSIKINDKEILSAPVATWHDKPYNYEMPVKDGQEITLEVKQQYHEYTEEELRDVILKLNSKSDYVTENIDALIKELEKQLPIIDEETFKRRQLEDCASKVLSSLTAYRMDIKNIGTEKNNIEIEADDISVSTPGWLTDTQGIGKMLQGNAMNNTIKMKAEKDGILRIDFRGQDRRFEGKRIPIWIDYKSIKIDDNEILSMPIATWHDKPYRYEMPVKDGQELTLEIEQQYHQYAESELKNVILKLNPKADYVLENIGSVIKELEKQLPITDNETFKRKQQEDYVLKILQSLTSFRMDIKNIGTEKNNIDIKAENISVSAPKWLTDVQGIGKMLQGNAMNNIIKVKAEKDGVLRMDFRGQKKRYNEDNIPLWIDYKSIKIDGKEILSAPVATWHDMPYRYEMLVLDGQEITIEIEQQYHEYMENELKDILFKLNPEDEYIGDNIDNIIKILSRKFPIVEEKTKLENIKNHHYFEYIKRNILPANPVTVSFEKISRNLNGRYIFKVNNVGYESVVLNSATKKMYVTLSAVGNNENTQYPVFHRVSFCSEFDGMYLCFDDPTRKEYNFAPAYYFGNPQHHYLRDILNIIKKIADINQIKYEDITFISSSNGGFASLWLCNELEGSRCFAYCPQIDIPLHRSSNFINGWNLEKVSKDRINLQHLINNSKSNFFIYSNIKCNGDRKQMELWFKYYNKELKEGITNLSENVKMLIVDIDGIAPHNIQPGKFFTSYLINEYCYSPNDHKLQVYIDELKESSLQELRNKESSVA